MRSYIIKSLTTLILLLISACATEYVEGSPTATYECSDVVVLGRALNVRHSNNEEPEGNLIPNTKITVKDVIWGFEDRDVIYALRLSRRKRIRKDIDHIFVLIPTYHGYLVRGVYISNELNQLEAAEVCPIE
jgi:hypothetical protein